ncbi:MAG: RecQ family ATP-dependent DNA helicase, partial [Planctomycetota bacterium]
MSTSQTNQEDALRTAIRQHWGYEGFLPLQRESMQCVLDHQDSVVVLPTGGGKSLCFQVPALCQDGLAVVVSPLISLMVDQVQALNACGVAAACINSTMSYADRRQVAQAVEDRELKLLYVAPERLVMPKTLEFLSQSEIAFFAIDEAHCISSWGHDFRPEYRGLRILKERFPELGVHAYTATATETVRQDIADQLALQDPTFHVGTFDRPNLNYKVMRRKDGLNQIRGVIDRHPNESGIVYCISR